MIDRTFLILATLICCQSFGQLHPQIAYEGKPTKFTQEMVLPIDANTKNKIRLVAIKPIGKLISSGTHNLGGFDLILLNKKLSEVNIVVLKSGYSPIGGGRATVRLSGASIVEAHTIYLSYDDLIKNQNKDRILLHEFLIAAGYPDLDYKISTLIISAANNSKIVPLIKKMPPLQLNQKSYVKKMQIRGRGGVTVVGGGGDDIILDMKIFMSENLPEWKETMLPLLLKNEVFNQILQKEFSKNSSDLINEDVLNEYYEFFLGIPIEVMNHFYNPPEGPISWEDVDKIAIVYESPEIGGYYIRFSRDHWNIPFIGKSLQESRKAISMKLHTELLAAFLLEKYK